MHYFIGIEVIQSTAGIFISQKKCARAGKQVSNERLQSSWYPNRNRSKACQDLQGKRVDSIFYKQIVGNLMYLSGTRPNMMHVVSLIS